MTTLASNQSSDVSQLAAAELAMRVELLEAMLRAQSERRRESAFAGFQGMKWRETLGGRLVQVLALPLTAVLMAVLGVLEAVQHFAENRDLRNTQRHIQGEIDRLRAGDLQVPEIRPKTIEALWYAYDVRAAGLSHEQELQLLAQWIDRLYGPTRRQGIDLEGRVLAMQAERAALARQRRSDMLVTLVPITSAIVRDISRVLPAYEDAIAPGVSGGAGPYESRHADVPGRGVAEQE